MTAQNYPTSGYSFPLYALLLSELLRRGFYQIKFSSHEKMFASGTGLQKSIA
jgi:hypothetical protein